MGPFDQAISWSTQGVAGVKRFLDKVWKLSLACKDNDKSSKDIERGLHKLIKRIDEEMEDTKFNTIIAAFMEFTNLCREKKDEVSKDTIEKLLIILSPFAPHICEELWSQLGHKESICKEKWPKFDKKLIKDERVTMIIQINGKMRDKMEVDSEISEEEAKKLAISLEKVNNWIAGREIKKVVFVKGKLLNIVI